MNWLLKDAAGPLEIKQTLQLDFAPPNFSVVKAQKPNRSIHRIGYRGRKISLLAHDFCVSMGELVITDIRNRATAAKNLIKANQD